MHGKLSPNLKGFFVFKEEDIGQKFFCVMLDVSFSIEEEEEKERKNGYNQEKKSRIREPPTLSTDANSRTDTNLKRLCVLSIFFFFFV